MNEHFEKKEIKDVSIYINLFICDYGKHLILEQWCKLYDLLENVKHTLIKSYTEADTPHPYLEQLALASSGCGIAICRVLRR